MLDQFPNLGRPLPTDDGGRAYVFRSHVILYRIAEPDTIEIVRIRHGREDWC